MVVKKALSLKNQLAIAQMALNEFAKPPHRNNLYIYEPEYLQDKNNLYADNKGYDINKFLISDPERFFFNTKIRWANLGIHYDWDNRCYFKDSVSPINELMRAQAQFAMDLLEINDSYKPESVIVNYYGKKDYMGGHLDDGEPD